MPHFLFALFVLATAPDTSVVPMQEVVVSATKTPRATVNVANATSVVTGADLRRRGTHTLADALQDVVGFDTGNGSDNGMRLPNLGLWGLKEFDALLVTLDGVPVGGPFNPSLSQIPVEDLDRIEVVKGPQGTLYGVSAFAGMVQAFSRTTEPTAGHLTVGGGSFSQWNGDAGWQWNLGGNTALRLSGTALHADGWQDRTGAELERGDLHLSRTFGAWNLGVGVMGFHDAQDWGTPLPFDAGAIVPGFEIDRNYAIRDAEMVHDVYGVNTRAAVPIGSMFEFQNTLAWTHDEQKILRSFLGEVDPGGDVESEAIQLEPEENSLYEDARLVSHFQAGGAHELVGGAAVTWGETKGFAQAFEFDQSVANYPDPDLPSVGELTATEERDFEDQRTFIGVYLHDEWTPVTRLTIGGGGRFDHVSEELETEGEAPGGGGDIPLKDEKEDGAWSGDVSVLFRSAPQLEWLQAANWYVNYKSSFKPAAPNLSEAEAAEILEPEWTHSIEGGFKGRAFESQLALDLSVFQMDFQNMVVSILAPGGGPELVNAGRERFKGYEATLTYSPRKLPGLSLSGGYAHHDARFVEFTFVTPEGELRDVSGNHLELVPENMVNVKAHYAPEQGVGGFVAVRYQGERPFNRRNTFFADAYTEWDAGLSARFGAALVSVVGRNLGDDRHVVTESEIGDAQFYVAPPRRVVAQLTWQF